MDQDLKERYGLCSPQEREFKSWHNSDGNKPEIGISVFCEVELGTLNGEDGE